MIDHSPAIAESKAKILYIREKGILTIISDGKNEKGKWHVLDIAFGDRGQVRRDLLAQGYTLKEF